MKKKKLMLFSLIILVVFVLVVAISVTYKQHSDNTTANIPTPSDNLTSDDDIYSISDISTEEDALLLMEHLYHEDGYEFILKEQTETEIVVEKINSKTNEVVSVYNIDRQDEAIINYQTEQSTVTSE